MRKNFWAALLALCLTLTLGLIPAQAADDKWTDFATPDWGTGGDYTIYSAGDLAAFAAAVNGGNSFGGEAVTLADDIDLSGYEWVPIGTQDHPFSGTFNGQGYEISNCTFTSAENGEQYLSLFGKAENANITDFTVRNFAVDVITAGYNSTAVLAAPVAGDVQNTKISKIEVLNA